MRCFAAVPLDPRPMTPLFDVVEDLDYALAVEALQQVLHLL